MVFENHIIRFLRSPMLRMTVLMRQLVKKQQSRKRHVSRPNGSLMNKWYLPTGTHFNTSYGG